MVPDTPGLTALLVRMRTGDHDAGNQAFDLVYTELRKIAGLLMRREPDGHTLSPTALVAEVYLRLKSGSETLADREHFMRLAAKAMRHLLIDHARQKRAVKRGRDFQRVEPDDERISLDNLPGADSIKVDLIDLADALEQLATLDPRAAEVVELRFFGGCTDQEVCNMLGDNMASVRRRWKFAQSWLKTRLESGTPA
jgi:RNA polymerase sigma factor (TIGR02999 family)